MAQTYQCEMNNELVEAIIFFVKMQTLLKHELHEKPDPRYAIAHVMAALSILEQQAGIKNARNFNVSEKKTPISTLH